MTELEKIQLNMKNKRNQNKPVEVKNDTKIEEKIELKKHEEIKVEITEEKGSRKKIELKKKRMKQSLKISLKMLKLKLM